MKRVLLSAFTGALLLASILAPAVAGPTASAKDPDDTRSRLDIRYVAFERRNDSAILTIRTAERWRCGFLRDDTTTAQGVAEAYEDGKVAFLQWAFESDRDNNVDHSGNFRCKDRRLRFEINRQDLSYKVRRPDRRTVKLSLPLSRFGLRQEGLRVYAVSLLNGQFGDETFFEERDDSPRLRPYKGN
jgi:hypothetical protein